MDYWSFRGEKAWWSSESIPGYFRGLFAFQVTSSPRDNASYRAAFTRQNHPLDHPSGDPPMTTAASDPQIVPRPSASMPALRAADRGVADALQSVLSNNTRRVYAAQWRLFTTGATRWTSVPRQLYFPILLSQQQMLPKYQHLGSPPTSGIRSATVVLSRSLVLTSQQREV